MKPPARILIVDDELHNRRILNKLLTAKGHECHEAEEGAEALAAVETFKPNLILLDLNMPGMDGFAFLAARQSNDELRMTPVIIVSAENDAESAVLCMQAGAEDYLTKPIKPAIVLHRVSAWLEQAETRRRAELLGSYRVTARLGKGGSGEVFLANHALLRRAAAIKILRRTDAKSIAMFENEVQRTCELEHPNTISVYDYGRAPNGSFYYVMEYLEGINLAQLLGECPDGIPDGRVIFLLRQLCGSLVEAHDKGLIHRDLKAANVMLGERAGIYDFVKVLDFGIACNREDLRTTDPDAMVGTPLYMSPEQICEPDNIDSRSDIYAIGVLAYALMTGKRIFESDGVALTLQAHIDQTPELPSQRTGNAHDPGLEALVMACVSKDPEHRPQTVRDLLGLLESCSSAHLWDQQSARGWWLEHQQDLLRTSGSLPKCTDAVAVDFSQRF